MYPWTSYQEIGCIIRRNRENNNTIEHYFLTLQNDISLSVYINKVENLLGDLFFLHSIIRLEILTGVAW